VGELLTYRGESNKRRFCVIVHDLVYFNGIGRLRVGMLTKSHLIHYYADGPDVTRVRVVFTVEAFGRPRDYRRVTTKLNSLHITKGTSVSTCDLRIVTLTQLFTDAEVRQFGPA
jgi:hypothetical protein